MESLRLTLPREVVSVRRARGVARATVIRWGSSPEHADAVEFVVGELVTESLEEGVGPLLLAIQSQPGTTRVEVSDGLTLSDTVPAARKRTVHGVARDIGVTDTSGGRTIWADVDDTA